MGINSDNLKEKVDFEDKIPDDLDLDALRDGIVSGLRLADLKDEDCL